MEPIASSFRDPNGFLFIRDGKYCRMVNPSYSEHYDQLMSSGLYQQLTEKQWLIPHQEEPADNNGHMILVPDQLKYVSYPYEWCFSQLKDAAILTLEIQLAALDHGMTLKDASAYNIQLHNGKQIFKKDVTIIDDPGILKGLGSKPFDGEGIQVSKKEIESNGKLNTWILNTSTAKKLNFKTTGNASRAVGAPPGVSTSNFFMTNGILSYDDMIKSIKYGFYANELIGMGVNLVTGDYSMGASGMLIENGEITHAVSEVTIASNLTEMFLNLSAANDLELSLIHI